MLTATWFPVFKLPPCSPLRFPPHPDLSRDEIFPYFPGFRHSLIHRFKREWGRFKTQGKKKREKKRGSRVFRDWEFVATRTCCFARRKSWKCRIFNPKLQSRKQNWKQHLSTRGLTADLQQPRSSAPAELAHLLLLGFAPLLELS